MTTSSTKPSWHVLLYVVLYFHLYFVVESFQEKELGKGYFPTTIEVFEQRLHQGKPLRRGHIHKRLHGVQQESDLLEAEDPDLRKKPSLVSYEHFSNALQCADHEPDFNEPNGAISLMQMSPPSMETLYQVCVQAETRACSSPSRECLNLITQYKSGKYPEKFGVYEYSGFEEVHLFRVQNNELFIDWPWGRERIRDYQDAKPLRNDGSTMQRIDRRHVHNWWLIQNTLRMVKIKDSVFMLGCEQPVLPWLLPFPSFMFAPKLGHSEMPFPWPQSFREELSLYREAIAEHDDMIKNEPNTYNQLLHFNYSDEFYRKHTEQKPWNKKISKAAFYSTYDFQRRLVWDAAALRPDLIEAPLWINTDWKPFMPWNAQSREPDIRRSKELLKIAKETNHTAPGFISFLQNITSENQSSYKPGHYKYVVVVGIELAPTGRLAHIIAHSGAVVLLAKSAFFYHFSARLRPWVHYVPLTFSSADLIEKVEWLQQHDDLAQQIANNARNFGKSYLRMEDYYCFTAAALRLVADLEENTTLTKPFIQPRAVTHTPTIQPTSYSSMMNTVTKVSPVVLPMNISNMVFRSSSENVKTATP